METETETETKRERKREREVSSDSSSEEAPAKGYYSDESDIEGVVDEEMLEKYRKQVKDSDGFDITDSPGFTYATPIVPLTNLHDCRPSLDRVIGLSELAIQYINQRKPRTKYKFLKVEKANAKGCCGIDYYITFQAEELDRHNPAVRTFQAKVCRIIGEPPEVELCRLKKESIDADEKVASDLPAE